VAKKTIVQRLDTDTGVVGPAESYSASIEEFSYTGSAVEEGSFVYVNTSTGEVNEAQANSSATLAYGVVTKLLSSTKCEVMTSGITVIKKSGVSAGAILYLSPTSAGSTTTALTNSDTQFIQPVAKVLSVSGSYCTVQLLLTSAPANDLSNLLKLDRFMLAVNSNDGSLVLGDNDDTLTPDPAGYKLEVIGGVKSSSSTVTGQVSAASASITGAMTSGSASITGAMTAGSASISGPLSSDSFSTDYISVADSGALNGSLLDPLTGTIYASIRVGSGNTAISPRAYLDGATGTVHGITVEASGSLTGAGLSITGVDSTSISTNGGIDANGKIYGGTAEFTNSSSYGYLSVNKYDSTISLNNVLGIIRLGAVEVAGGSPAGGADLYCFAGEDWTVTAKGSRLSLRTTDYGANTLSARVTLDQDAAIFGVDIDLNGHNVLPFTGSHVYPCDTEIPVGSCVVLNNGKAEIASSARAKNCVGVAIVSKIITTDSLSGTSEGLKVLVAAVGDNRASGLTGFLVCNENGQVEAGDLLCTSSTPGYLMKQDDDIIRSYTVGKALETPVLDSDGKASGVYGFLYCG
jgi:hypothetical protein